LKVSILIPCFNAESFVAETIQSALNQSYEQLEIIVVDDGSNDGSAEQIAKHSDPRLQMISQSNRGHSAAVNAAFARSTGKYIKYLDADDVISPDHIALQVERLNASSGAVAMGEWARFYSDDPYDAKFVSREMYRDADPVEWLASEWLDARPMTQCGAFLIPRDIIEQSGGWDEELTLIDDFEFFTRMLLHAKQIVFTPGAKLHYRSGQSESLSGRKDRKSIESAYLSLMRGTRHLISTEDSARTRRASANLLQDFVYTYYPLHADLRNLVRARVEQLGGSDLEPDGPPRFHHLRKLTGWRLARRVQRLMGR